MDWQNVVVTGASRGVGEVLVQRLAAQGKKVFAFARSEDKLRELEEQSDGAIVALPLDVRSPSQIAAAYERIEREFGPIDVLVNNAGVFQTHDFWTQDLEVIDRIIDINLKGALYCTRLVLPYMVGRKRGRIINIASVSGTHGIPGQVAYGASKHGMIGMADVLAQELQPFGIKVTTICPGAIDTPLWNVENNPYPDDAERMIKSEEVAELVEFVLSRPDSTIYKRVIFFPDCEWH
jgi:NAD(P)-dependent dehydrogenase (short-subunit alcohol dehydrogenase family)